MGFNSGFKGLRFSNQIQ